MNNRRKEDQESIEDQLHWPRENQKIFTEPDTKKYQQLSCIDYRGKDHRYVMGFAKAGAVLADAMLRSGHDLDILVYPMLFSFRHAVELELKLILPDALRCLNEEAPLKFDHKLPALWDFVRRAVIAVSPGSEDSMISTAALLEELVDVDADGTAFRYATRKNGEETFSRRYVDVKAAAEALLALANSLEAASTVLDEHLKERAEYESAMRDDFGFDEAESEREQFTDNEI